MNKTDVNVVCKIPEMNNNVTNNKFMYHNNTTNNEQQQQQWSTGVTNVYNKTQ